MNRFKAVGIVDEAANVIATRLLSMHFDELKAERQDPTARQRFRDGMALLAKAHDSAIKEIDDMVSDGTLQP